MGLFLIDIDGYGLVNNILKSIFCVEYGLRLWLELILCEDVLLCYLDAFLF